MILKYPPLERIAGSPPTLMGSRDGSSGRVYYPPRHFSDDGSLRPTEFVALSTKGVLYSYAEFRGMGFGHVHLPEGTRIPTVLGDGPHELGATYEFELIDAEKGQWRFSRA
ncbi:MAG: hypothetical protein M2R45_04924 [Verrucomicrobia subdivision 3 bacterium]|nr:hypothetical protein [Limisphaerales bacterium]